MFYIKEGDFGNILYRLSLCIESRLQDSENV